MRRTRINAEYLKHYASKIIRMNISYDKVDKRAADRYVITLTFKQPRKAWEFKWLVRKAATHNLFEGRAIKTYWDADWDSPKGLTMARIEEIHEFLKLNAERMWEPGLFTVVLPENIEHKIDVLKDNIDKMLRINGKVIDGIMNIPNRTAYMIGLDASYFKLDNVNRETNDIMLRMSVSCDLGKEIDSSLISLPINGTSKYDMSNKLKQQMARYERMFGTISSIPIR